ncbi:cytochrome c oxidase subunit IVB [Oceanobacillus massiliensis]|uniref:cytochrome c oxidase subunit IVB n=1 Tax=Oceanobacillus massiliensis TaxID=1465765 RepID=UPI000289F879|nr:cytochrome c oxidase subunit IVB [Oceanobacillus massiliensis]
MTENTNTNKINSFRKEENREEMRKQIVTFALMIFFTLIAFFAVLMGVSSTFVIPLILILALVQVGFQFYYFMHMKDKGHEVPSALMYGGIFVAFLVIATFVGITWW